MSVEIACAVIAGGSSIVVGALAYCGVAVTNKKANVELQQKMEVHLAVTDNKIENLTKEVRKHNNFAERIPKLEQKLEDISNMRR